VDEVHVFGPGQFRETLENRLGWIERRRSYFVDVKPPSGVEPHEIRERAAGIDAETNGHGAILSSVGPGPASPLRKA
jgi:hypothetical protein